MCAQRVIGSEFVEQIRQRGQITLEVMPGDIVTAVAEETAQRLGIKLFDGPVEKPASVHSDGATSTRRSLYRRSPKWMAPKSAARGNAQQRFNKLAIVGAGGVGATLAHLIYQADICEDLTLIDIVPGLAESTALDLNHCAGVTLSRTRASGGEQLSMLAGSQVVLVTAGKSRTPGMSRTDLVTSNKRIIRLLGETIRIQVPGTVVIVITNPLDEMTLEMLDSTGFARTQVLGMAGTLDSSRFRQSLAMAAKVPVADVSAMALGAHGDEMVPITSLATIKGRALAHSLSQERIAACVNDAITGGGQVVALKKTGSATYAPAHAALQLLERMCGASTGPVPVSVMLQGEYGIVNGVVGVPAHLGMKGLIAVEELPLTQDELAALKKSVSRLPQNQSSL